MLSTDDAVAGLGDDGAVALKAVLDELQGAVEEGGGGGSSGPSAEEAGLAIVRGRFAGGSDGGPAASVLQGEGFSVARLDYGTVRVTFDTPFAGIPVVVLTGERDVDGNCCSTGIKGGTVSAAAFTAISRDNANNRLENVVVTFIAIG